ncbi:acyltransferase [Kitasatospora sp. NPDC096077]|uniref:acyltransferase family protein n=1 Tax=Kitasatospora sp. NPDC096077 TaxID=3155544 RepID=UPI00332AF31B
MTLTEPAAARPSVLEPLRSVVHRIESTTPLDRDRGIDGLRALALLSVPLGHWLLGGFTVDDRGALHNASPLTAMGYLSPVSWVLQMLAIFFLVGGYSSALSLGRTVGRGEGTGAWIRRRMLRLGRPTLAVTAIWAVLLVALRLLGVPGDSLHTAATLVIQPLWFVAVYAGLSTLTPLCRAAARRMGCWSVLPLVAVVAVVDLLRYGPAGDAVPSWLGLVNLVPGWLFGYQLGVCWSVRRLGRTGARLLLVAGIALFTVLLTQFHYPASMVGVPGVERTNSHPPSLLVIALACVQCGLAVLVRERLGRLLSRPGLWSTAVVLNLSAMTVFCWHQSAMLSGGLPGALVGAVPGLTTSPDSPGWALARLCWIPLFAVALIAIGLATRRFEQPWTGVFKAHRTAAVVLSLGFVGYALLG